MNTRIVVEAPDLIATTDLVERLGGASAQTRPLPGDAYHVIVPRISSPAGLRRVLAAIGAWAEFWELDGTPIRVGNASYELHGRRSELGWIDA